MKNIEPCGILDSEMSKSFLKGWSTPHPLTTCPSHFPGMVILLHECAPLSATWQLASHFYLNFGRGKKLEKITLAYNIIFTEVIVTLSLQFS